MMTSERTRRRSAPATISAVCRARTSGLVSTTSKTTPRRDEPARRLPHARRCRPRSAAAWRRRATRRRAPRRSPWRIRYELVAGRHRSARAPRLAAGRGGERSRGSACRRCATSALALAARSARAGGGSSSSSDAIERVEIAPDRHVRRRQRRLHLPDPLDQAPADRACRPSSSCIALQQRAARVGRCFGAGDSTTSSSA